jgi:hypothetical protein
MKQNNIYILNNGHLVSRDSDFIIYSVEAEAIDRVVAEFGPCPSSPFSTPTLTSTDSSTQQQRRTP